MDGLGSTDADSSAPRLRILVVSAGMGAGHHAAAGELVRRLTEAGHRADQVDVLKVGRPGQGERLQRTYAFLLRRTPWVYDWAMRFWRRWPRPLEAFTARGARPYDRGLLREIARVDPDVIVSAYNLSSQALGRLRADGRLRLPVVTYVTDPGAHPYWVHPAVDLHLAVLPSTTRALQGYGARRTRVVGPLVAPQFRPAGTDRAAVRERARQRLGLPTSQTLALVSAGSWAAGGVERTVARLAGSGTVLPVTLCGRDEQLRLRLTSKRFGIALGWTDDMATLMAAADVLVDNAGGLTCWEALVAGLPVVLCNPLPGHGKLNAEALADAGLARYVRDQAELVAAVLAAAQPVATRIPALFTGDAAEAVVDLAAPAAATFAA